MVSFHPPRVPPPLLAMLCYVNDGLRTDDILFDKTINADDLLGLDHVNKNRAGGAKGDSIFIR